MIDGFSADSLPLPISDEEDHDKAIFIDSSAAAAASSPVLEVELIENCPVDKDASATSGSETNSEVLNVLITDELLTHESAKEELKPPASSEEHLVPLVEMTAQRGEASEPDNSHEVLNDEPSEELVALGLLTSMEKLSLLCSLINTLHFLEDEILLDGGWSSIKKSSAYTLIAAARESQKRLVKLLSTSNLSRPALCCAAIKELVRAYPPHRLLPSTFLDGLFVDEKKIATTQTELAVYQDHEAANFWDMLMSFAVSLMDEHGNTADQVASMLADFLFPELSYPTVRDVEEAEVEFHLFLVSHICCRVMYKGGSTSLDGVQNERSDSGSARLSFQSKVDGSEHELRGSPEQEIGSSSNILKLQVLRKSNKASHQNKGRLWNAVVGGFAIKSLAWRRKPARSKKLKLVEQETDCILFQYQSGTLS